jgi:hypothetical protein
MSGEARDVDPVGAASAAGWCGSTVRKGGTSLRRIRADGATH